MHVFTIQGPMISMKNADGNTKSSHKMVHVVLKFVILNVDDDYLQYVLEALIIVATSQSQTHVLNV